MAFVRFVVDSVNEDSGHRLGVFNAAASLRDRGELSADELKVLADAGQWLDLHLPRPTRFTRKRNDSHRRPRAPSRTTLRDLARLLKTTTRPDDAYFDAVQQVAQAQSTIGDSPWEE
jgi:hypothetical protein